MKCKKKYTEKERLRFCMWCNEKGCKDRLKNVPAALCKNKYDTDDQIYLCKQTSRICDYWIGNAVECINYQQKKINE